MGAEMRESKLVERLHKAIDKKFQANAHKGEAWKFMTNEQLRGLIFTELNELFTSLEGGDYENAMDEAADVSLCCAFLADPDRVIICLKTYRNAIKSLDKVL